MNINEDTLLAATFLFERERGMLLTIYEERIIANSNIDLSSINDVSEFVKAYIKTNVKSAHKLVGAAIFALGKRCEPSDKIFFVSVLEQIIDIDIDAAFQAMIALENMGEDIFEGSANIHEKKRNYLLGKKYIMQQKA